MPLSSPHGPHWTTSTSKQSAIKMWSVFATCLTSGLIMFISLNRRPHLAKSHRSLWWLQSRINDTNHHQKNVKITTRISSDQLNINRRGQYRFILAERSCEHLLKFWATEQETLSLFLLSTRNRRDSFSIITSVAILLPTSEENGPFLAPRCENKLQHDAQLTRLKVKASLRARDVPTVRKSICTRGEEVTTHENKNGKKLSGDLIMFHHFPHRTFIFYNTRRDHLRKVEAMFGNVGYVYVVCWTDLHNFTVSLQMLSKCNDSVSVWFFGQLCECSAVSSFSPEHKRTHTHIQRPVHPFRLWTRSRALRTDLESDCDAADSELA